MLAADFALVFPLCAVNIPLGVPVAVLTFFFMNIKTPVRHLASNCILVVRLVYVVSCAPW